MLALRYLFNRCLLRVCCSASLLLIAARGPARAIATQATEGWGWGPKPLRPIRALVVRKLCGE